MYLSSNRVYFRSRQSHGNKDVMLQSPAIRHCASSRLPLAPRLRVTWHGLRLLPLNRSALKLQVVKTLACTQSTHTRPRDAYTYPENLNIYDSGILPAISIGFMRIVTMVFAAYGVLWAAPSVIFSGAAPWYTAPIYAILPAIPMVVTGVFFGGFVSHINVWLPRNARRSKADLIRFAGHPPPNTLIQIKSMWFRPWPHTREVQFQDLKRLPRTWSRLTNLEHQPLWDEKTTAQAKQYLRYDWLARTWMGRYAVRTRQLRDRSRVSGVWEKMWEQIPMAGEASAESKAPDRPRALSSARRNQPPTAKARR